MAVILDGGCRVSTMHEGEPRVDGSLKIWNQIGKTSGATAISMRVLEFGPGTSPVLRNHTSDEVFYVLEGLTRTARAVPLRAENTPAGRPWF